jgi:hypothetical protein
LEDLHPAVYLQEVVLQVGFLQTLHPKQLQEGLEELVVLQGQAVLVSTVRL